MAVLSLCFDERDIHLHDHVQAVANSVTIAIYLAHLAKTRCSVGNRRHAILYHREFDNNLSNAIMVHQNALARKALSLASLNAISALRLVSFLDRYFLFQTKTKR